MRIGYCALTADFLHIGHIRFLKACRAKCDRLVVGIMTDECVRNYKGHDPIMNYESRKEIIESLKFVATTRPQDSFAFPHDLFRAKELLGENLIIFDCKDHNRIGADVLIPYMRGISSSKFREVFGL